MLAGAIPVLLLPQPVSFVLAIAIFIFLTLTDTFLEMKLKSYLTFDATFLLTPSIKNLTLFLILALSFGYFLSINSKIKTEGFEIPDALIDQALKIAAPPSLNFKGEKYLAQLPQLTEEQIKLLKQNPELLKQSGVDPKMLDSIPKSSSASKQINSKGQTSQTSNNLGVDFAKSLVKDQFKNMIKPYLNFVAPILALLFFLGLQSFSAILSILVSPLIWFIFKILESSGFVKFTTEMREVKKMVV